MSGEMTDRQRIDAMLHYRDFDRVPLIHMGFWNATIIKWVEEGHIPKQELDEFFCNGFYIDGGTAEQRLAERLGFDDTYLFFMGQKDRHLDFPLYPVFEEKIIERYDDGRYKKLQNDGVYVIAKDDITCIPAEMDHTLKDRGSWEEHYKPRLVWNDERIDTEKLAELIAENETRTRSLGLQVGSLFGKVRNYWGIVGVSYLMADDFGLLQECVDTIADVSYGWAEYAFAGGLQPDFAHFWEDICYRSGPLFSPDLIRELTGKHYRRIADLCGKNGVDIVSLDCDGYIDDLVPVWLDNGVNTMFPLEVGAWEYDFSTMRKKFGKEILGVGNVNKNIFSKDRKTIDAEVERVKRLVDLGGFVPCIDHRIAPDAEWDLVLYYCEQMRKAF